MLKSIDPTQNPYFRSCEHFLFEYVEANRNQHEIERYDADFNRGCWQMAVTKVQNNEQPD